MADYYTVQDGDWDSSSTWHNGDIPPQSTDSLDDRFYNLTIDHNVVMSLTGDRFYVISSSYSININGALKIINPNEKYELFMKGEGGYTHFNFNDGSLLQLGDADNYSKGTTILFYATMREGSRIKVYKAVDSVTTLQFEHISYIHKDVLETLETYTEDGNLEPNPQSLYRVSSLSSNHYIYLSGDTRDNLRYGMHLVIGHNDTSADYGKVYIKLLNDGVYNGSSTRYDIKGYGVKYSDSYAMPLDCYKNFRGSHVVLNQSQIYNTGDYYLYVQGGTTTDGPLLLKNTSAHSIRQSDMRAINVSSFEDGGQCDVYLNDYVQTHAVDGLNASAYAFMNNDDEECFLLFNLRNDGLIYIRVRDDRYPYADGSFIGGYVPNFVGNSTSIDYQVLKNGVTSLYIGKSLQFNITCSLSTYNRLDYSNSRNNTEDLLLEPDGLKYIHYKTPYDDYYGCNSSLTFGGDNAGGKIGNSVGIDTSLFTSPGCTLEPSNSTAKWSNGYTKIEELYEAQPSGNKYIIVNEPNKPIPLKHMWNTVEVDSNVTGIKVWCKLKQVDANYDGGCYIINIVVAYKGADGYWTSTTSPWTTLRKESDGWFSMEVDFDNHGEFIMWSPFYHIGQAIDSFNKPLNYTIYFDPIVEFKYE